MCLHSVKIENQKIATKDIIVYKMVGDVSKKECVSVFEDFKYIKDEKNPIISLNIIESYISQGYHSYPNMKTLHLDDDFYSNNFRINIIPMKFMIPKGSIYYQGVFGIIPCLVSNQIIFLGEI